MVIGIMKKRPIFIGLAAFIFVLSIIGFFYYSHSIYVFILSCIGIVFSSYLFIKYLVKTESVTPSLHTVIHKINTWIGITSVYLVLSLILFFAAHGGLLKINLHGIGWSIIGSLFALIGLLARKRELLHKQK